MALTPEQILSAHKANIDAIFGLTTKAFEGVEKLIELNVNASRAALTEAAAHSQALAAAKDVQDLVNLQTAFFQPLAEKPLLTTGIFSTLPAAPAPNCKKPWKTKQASTSKASTA